MSWSGGNYTKGNAATGGWTGDASLGIGIEAGRHDTQDNDFATGINQCLNKDGSNSMTGNLNFGGNIPTNLGAGTAAAPALCMNNDTNTGFFSAAADQIGVATNGTERIRINTTGQLGLGTSNPSVNLDIQGTATSVNTTRFSADGNGPIYDLQKSRAATVGTNTIVQNNDILGVVRFNGANGTGYTEGAYVAAFVDGTPGASNDMPTRLIFATTADGAGIATERLRIAADGKVGVGQTAPDVNLHVGNGSGQTILRIQGSTSGSGGGSALAMPQGVLGNISAVDGGAYNAGMKLRSYGGGLTLTADSGGFGITGLSGSTGGSFMKVNTGTGQWFYDTSARRYKENIRDSELGLETVKALRPRQYNYIYEGTPEDVGFIAEEIEPILPFLVAKNANNECESITYDRLTSVLVKAVQELNAKVEALEARIAAIES